MKLKFGPAIGPHARKGDVPVAYSGHKEIDGVDHFHLSIPAHSAKHAAAKLIKAYVVMADRPMDDGETPESFLAKGHPTGSIDVGDVTSGAELAIPVPHLAPGDYDHSRFVLGFEDDSVTPVDPTVATPEAPASTPEAAEPAATPDPTIAAVAPTEAPAAAPVDPSTTPPAAS